MENIACEDEMIEAVVGILVSQPEDPRTVVSRLVMQWPDAPILQIIYVISMAASAVEHMLSGPDVERAAQDAWRMAGLLGVDLYAMERLGLPRLTARDMSAYWLEHDKLFFRW